MCSVASHGVCYQLVLGLPAAVVVDNLRGAGLVVAAHQDHAAVPGGPPRAVLVLHVSHVTCHVSPTWERGMSRVWVVAQIPSTVSSTHAISTPASKPAPVVPEHSSAPSCECW